MSDDPTRRSAAAGGQRRSRLGPTLLLVGLAVGIMGRRLPGDPETIAFERPPDPLSVTFSPSSLMQIVSLGFLLLAGLSMVLERRSEPAVRRVAVGWGLGTTLPVILALALAYSEKSSTNATQLVVESLRLGTPVALGAMSGLWCERSGVVNIGIEGMMLASAGVGFMVYAVLGDANRAGWLWFSIAVSVVLGGLVGALHALMSVTFRVDQIISGVVINLLALGVTGFLRSEVIVPSGVTAGVPTDDVGLPLLSDIPVFGRELFTGRPIFFAMFAIVAGSWFVLFRTPFGLRVRSVGENPHAAETLGIDVVRTRYTAVIIGGCIAGLAGAWFSMESQGGFQDNMTNGTGFIALAALIFGKWRPGLAFVGALLFGFTRALGSRLQILDVEVADFGIPSEFWQSLPFVVTIVVVAGLLGRAVPPASVGIPFERSR